MAVFDSTISVTSVSANALPRAERTISTAAPAAGASSMPGNWIPPTPQSRKRVTRPRSMVHGRRMEVMPAARAARARSSARSKPALPCSQSMNATSNPSPPACSTSDGEGKFGLKTKTVPPSRSFCFALFI
jgi:hypothetical protein